MDLAHYRLDGRGGEETRARTVEAALETLKQEGIVGTSARAIGRTGGFNQALILYHFGSVTDLLLAGAEKMVAERMARYERRLAEVRALPDLVAVATELHREDVRDGFAVTSRCAPWRPFSPA